MTIKVSTVATMVDVWKSSEALSQGASCSCLSQRVTIFFWLHCMVVLSLYRAARVFACFWTSKSCLLHAVKVEEAGSKVGHLHL